MTMELGTLQRRCLVAEGIKDASSGALKPPQIIWIRGLAPVWAQDFSAGPNLPSSVNPIWREGHMSAGSISSVPP